MTTRSPVRRHPEAGITLMEMVIVLAIIGTMLVWIVPSFLGTLNRTRMVSASREIATLLQVARLEAIKKGGINGDTGNRVTALWCEPLQRTCQIFIDDSPPAPPADPLPWNPVTPVGGVYTLPTGVSFRAPTEATGGLRSINQWDEAGEDMYNGPIFRSDGSVTRAGAYRIADERGNFLEIAVVFPATGKVVIQKWFGGGDPNANWFENGENQMKWQW